MSWIVLDYLSRFSESSDRTQNTIKNAIVSLVAKMISVIAPLLIIPLTIDYVNPTQYGIWLTLSTVIGWVVIFDMGLGNGLRNKLAETIAVDNVELGNQYVSTTYFVIGFIVTVIFILFGVANKYLIDWTEVLNVDASYKEELQKVAFIVFGFFSLNLFVNIFSQILAADQKIGLSSLITGVGQILSLLVIYVLTKVSEGSLYKLALFFSGVPCLLMSIVSFYSFTWTKYKNYRPHICNIRIPLIKQIVSIGSQFFVISICLLVVFQLVNVVLSREIGPISVTQYNVALRYFGIINTLVAVIVSPYWSAYTEAYVKNDMNWMKLTLSRLEKLWLAFCGLGAFLLIISPWFYKIWVGDSVSVPYLLSTLIMIYQLIMSLSTVYIYLINGLGTIRIQLIIYSISAVLSYPLLVLSARMFGVYGVVLIPSITLAFQAFVGKIQLKKILQGSAKGIWLK